MKHCPRVTQRGFRLVNFRLVAFLSAAAAVFGFDVGDLADPPALPVADFLGLTGFLPASLVVLDADVVLVEDFFLVGAFELAADLGVTVDLADLEP